MVSYFFHLCNNNLISISLNPYCSGRWSRTLFVSGTSFDCFSRLNPYCSGRWSRTRPNSNDGDTAACLNPYCSGRWSRTRNGDVRHTAMCLNPYCSGRWSRTCRPIVATRGVSVLILIVVEDGLVQANNITNNLNQKVSLNPYCSGRWSRTMLSCKCSAWN